MKPYRLTKCQMTRKIISLHHEGYTDDFLLLRPGFLWWLQGQQEFPVSETKLNFITLINEKRAHDCRFLLAIQIDYGQRGILFIGTEKVIELGKYVADGR